MNTAPNGSPFHQLLDDYYPLECADDLLYDQDQMSPKYSVDSSFSSGLSSGGSSPQYTQLTSPQHHQASPPPVFSPPANGLQQMAPVYEGWSSMEMPVSDYMQPPVCMQPPQQQMTAPQRQMSAPQQQMPAPQQQMPAQQQQQQQQQQMHLQPQQMHQHQQPMAVAGQSPATGPIPACPNSLMSWTSTHISHWTVDHVLDWLYSIVGSHNYGISGQAFRGELWNNVTGRDLCAMTQEQFIAKMPSHGSLLYDLFQELKRRSEFTQPKTVESDSVFVTPSQQPAVSSPNMLQNGHGGSAIQVAPPFLTQFGEPYEYDARDNFIDLFGEKTTGAWADMGDEGYTTPSSDMDSEPPNSPASACWSIGMCPEKIGKPRTNKIGKNPLGSKGNHLWEFVRDLLKNKDCNPKLIKWEDEKEGVFRFVQSEQVAKMWGQRKNNPNMTYEKLSRAMRYYYKRGILERVDGRRLVYKFGPNSHGWH